MGSRFIHIMGFLPTNFPLAKSLEFSTWGQAQDRRMDGQTDNGHHCIMPPPYVGGA